MIPTVATKTEILWCNIHAMHGRIMHALKKIADNHSPSFLCPIIQDLQDQRNNKAIAH